MDRRRYRRNSILLDCLGDQCDVCSALHAPFADGVGLDRAEDDALDD